MTESGERVVRWGALFDLDGVLIDSPVVHVRSWVEVFRPYGIELSPQRLHREEGRRSEEIARLIVQEYGLDIGDDMLAELIRRKREIYRRHAPHGLRPDARSALEELKAAEWMLGLVSGSVRRNVEAALNRSELEFFDVMITAESYERGKPDPEPYLTACRGIGLSPANCVAVENAPLGVTSAQAAGMKVVALTSTLPESELSEADFIVEDLMGLPELLKSVSES